MSGRLGPRIMHGESITVNNEVKFYFQPFSELQYQEDTPILLLVFENQPDLILTNSFPEIEAMRARMDAMRVRRNETVSFFSAAREDKMIPLGMVYIQQPWRRLRHKATWNIDSLNFYREVWERVFFAVRQVREMKRTNIVIVLPSQFRPENIKNDRRQENRLEKFVRTVTEAIVYANHTIEEFIKDKAPFIESATLTYFGEGKREVDNFFQRAIGEGSALGESTGYVRRLTLLPPNLKYPLEFVRLATGVAPEPEDARSAKWQNLSHHFFSPKVKVSYLYGTKEIEEFGLGLVATVGKGSAHEPVFLKVHYRPTTNRQKPVRRIVIIGKGVTFDTGGANLKTDGSMERMHLDMAGGATALGLVKLAADLNLSVEIIALVPLVENMIGPHGMRPGDIATAFDGKTVEIIDTDGEGRLILYDAIAYAERHLNADCTITIATLCDIQDLGPDLLKVVVGNDKLRGKVLHAEEVSAEKAFLFPRLEHFNEVDNEHIGDITDLLGEPSGVYYQVSSFVFLSNAFVHEKPEWIFVDISAVFESDADNYGCGPGFGLRFIWNILKQYA
ncbi:MAG: hypothetical protein Q8Q13_00595 [bacterium]|nr:hypothetical protein [bacterium]